MAYVKSLTSGTTFTSASSWNLCDTNSHRGLSTTTTVGNSVVYGNAWTAGGNYTYVGLVLYCSAPAASGTLTIALFLSAGTTPLATVTINNTDLVVGYNYVKFTTPYSVTSGTQYRIGMNTGGGVVTTTLGVAAGTNFTGIAVTNTVQGIAVTDTFYVLGDLTGQGTNTTATITMDNTGTTTYGSTGGSAFPSIIGNKGTLQYATSGSTNYQLRMQGNVNVYNGGTFTIGTQASPIPSTSTAKLEFVCATVQQFVLNIINGTVTSYGATKTGVAKLAANIAAAATTGTTDISTGWLSGDQLILPPTNRVQSQFDVPTLNGNASGTNLTFAVGLTFAHETSPSTPTASDIINLTRNVQILGQGSGLVGSNTTGIVINGGTVSFNYTTFLYLAAGNSSNTANNGFVSNITAANSSVTINGCAFYGVPSVGQYIIYHSSTQSTSTFNCTNTVCYGGSLNINSTAAITPSNTSLTNLTFFRCIINLSRLYVTLTDSTLAGGTSAGFVFNDNSITVQNGSVIGTIKNLIAYGCANYGFQLVSNNSASTGVISNLTAWRNSSFGLYFQQGTSPLPLIVSGATFTGNATANINIATSGPIYMTNITTNSHATYTTTNALQLSGTDRTYITNSSFGGTVAETSGINAGVNGFQFVNNIVFHNCTFGHATLVATQTLIPNRLSSQGVSSTNHNGVANSTFNWQQFGTITTDSTKYYSSTYSMRMTPTSSLWKMFSYPVKLAINANDTINISVMIRKSLGTGGETLYNGSQPRLMLAFTPLLGYTNHVVLDTANDTVDANNWEMLSASFTPTVTGVYEFFVDCDGTAGWVNVDNWYTDYIKDTTKMDYWFAGVPYTEITGVPKERSNAFVY